jgi:signal transduction histidine kinase
MDSSGTLHEKLVSRLEELRRRTAEERARTGAAIDEARRSVEGGKGGVSPATLQALIDAVDAARRADGEKSRLLADVSHDLKQPLLVLRMSVEMLERRLPETVGQREIERLQRTIDKMQEALEALERAARQDRSAPDDEGG